MSENFVDERLELVSLVFRLAGKTHFIDNMVEYQSQLKVVVFYLVFD